ncbi:MAG: succinate--CoA ligase subunit beta [Candidatus Methylomirabilales bacterium]
MFVEEHTAKQLLGETGIAVPRGRAVRTPEEVAQVARELGAAIVVKGLVPTGKRGRSGGVRFADNPEGAREAADQLLGSTLGGFVVEQVLVEERLTISRELYAAVTNDTSRQCPLLLFSSEGGMDIEAIHATSPDKILILPLHIRQGLDHVGARTFLHRVPLLEDRCRDVVAAILVKLYAIYRKLDAELVEINPLALTPSGEAVALDCKLVIDDSALRRHPNLPPAKPHGTSLELQAKAQRLLYVELDGDVGVLANGAGLTMATMDAITFYGGRPANFMEIGGDAYKKAAPALSIVLSNPRVKSLLVNLCGAFARTDVMVEGISAAWQTLQPRIPAAFSVHGTGEEQAIQMLRERLGIDPFEEMDDAVRAAIRMARLAH